MASVDLSVRCVTPDALSSDDLARWHAVQAAEPSLASPYFTPEFTRAVASVREDVRVAILADDDGPCAFFPHQRMGSTACPVGGTLNDFQAVIAPATTRWTPEDLLRATGASRLVFDHWIAAQGALVARAATVCDSPFADLGAGYGAYLATIEARSDQMLKVRQRQRKMAREHGPLRFAWRSQDPCALAQVIAWKSQQFQRTGLPDPFEHAWTRALLARIAATETEALTGWLSTLHVGERLIAAHFGMRCRDVLHYWLPVYDHEFHQYGPGLLLLVEILQAAAADGVARVEFGKGEDAWKPRFMTGATRVVEGCIERAGLRADLRQLGSSMAAALRRTPLRALGSWPMRRLRRLCAERRLR